MTMRIECRLILLSLLVSTSQGVAEEGKKQVTPLNKQSFEETRASAEKGDVNAQLMLGILYDEGGSVPRDEKEALKWLRLAAERNVAAAQNMVGLFYANGKGGAVDYEAAVKWFRLAASQNFSESQYFLGLCYCNGTGIPKDHKEGVRMYRLAAEQGHGRACYALALCYSSGEGIPKDDIEAIKWMQLAHAFDDERAMGKLKVLKGGKTPEQIAEAGRRGREFLQNLSPSKLTAIASQPETYTNKQLEFQISYSKDWRTSPSVNDAVWKISKSLTNELAAISISVAHYTGNDPSFLQKLLDQEENVIQEMRRRFPDGKILEKGKTFLGGFPAVYYKWNYTLKNFTTALPMVDVQITCLRNDMMYVVTFETNEASFQKTYPQFQAIISTFVFL